MKLKKIIAVLLSCLLIAGLISVSAFAADYTTVLTGSDFQHPKGNTEGQKTVNAIIDAMMADGVTSADGCIFCGDYDHDLTMLPGPTQKGITALTECVNRIVPAEASHVFVQGNHDGPIGTGGLSLSGNNDPADGSYGVFVINEDDYMWFNGVRSVIQGTADNLRKYLNEKLDEGFTAPIFVVSHLPMHYSYRGRTIGDGQYAQYIFDVLNEAGEKGLNIIFLFGHDHSSGWDDYLGASAICLEKGDSINICKLGNRFKWQTRTLNFTYMNAGYTGYYDNHNGGDDALTMCIFKIYEDKVVISRYAADGLHNVKAAGVTNAHKGEKGYDPNTEVKESGLTITLGAITDPSPIKGETTPLTEIIMYFFNILTQMFGAVC